AEKRVEIPGQFQHAGFGEWSPLAVNFPSLGFHEFVVRAGSVLIAAGGQKDAHGRKKRKLDRFNQAPFFGSQSGWACPQGGVVVEFPRERDIRKRGNCRIW